MGSTDTGRSGSSLAAWTP